MSDNLEDSLYNSTWSWIKWRMIYENWDHDHCLFCDIRICDYEAPIGVANYCWIHFYEDEVDYVPGNDSGYLCVCDNCYHTNKVLYNFIETAPDFSRLVSVKPEHA